MSLAIISSLGICQNTVSENNYNTVFKWTVFVTSDSIYRLTKFVEQNGNFYFSKGFVDSTFKEGEEYLKIDNGVISERQKLNYGYIDGIDTIIDCFSRKNTNFDSVIFINYYVLGSYVLQKLGESNLKNSEHNVIRLLSPCEISNLYNTSYYLIKIVFNRKDRAYINIKYGNSEDINGFEITQNDSTFIDNKYIKRINKKYAEIMQIGSLNQSSSMIPWILESNINNNYRLFIMSEDIRTEERNLKSVFRLRNLLLSIGLKYFSFDCIEVHPGEAHMPSIILE